ncbi:hypothetical protein DFH09DRAFT_433162 [Mycena vulgaris]|nr:hypothetical protein DFH09DRAFT_433162 [Mycena vulgaris]
MVAVTHDNELAFVLTETDDEVPDYRELISRMSTKFTPDIACGGACLQINEGSQDKRTDRPSPIRLESPYAWDSTLGANWSSRVDYPDRDSSSHNLKGNPDVWRMQVEDPPIFDSGMGWSDTAGPASPNVSPLRISKRDSPARRQPAAEVARRTSSSFKHVRNNNLVSKSPFKSQIPTAAAPALPRPFPSPTRRVSAEKRPRPQSMHDQAEAENDRPFPFKREHRQSKGFQGLIQMEPVTKSPFRLHGPRLSGRRERRKTVTFDERCDVVEFDRDEEDGMASSGDEYGDPGTDADADSDSDPFFAQPEPPQPDSSYESIDLSDTSLLPDTSMPLDLDPDASITGIVDAMFAPVAGTSTPPLHGSAHTRTYEYELEHALEHERDAHDHATDLDTEDGVPFGRSHHATRAAAFHTVQHHDHPPPVPQPHLATRAARPLSLPDTGATAATPLRSHAGSAQRSPPLGRTTHLERRRAAAEEDGVADNMEADVARLPGSSSPGPARIADLVEMGVSRFSLPSVGSMGHTGPDPFALPRLRDEPLPDVGQDSRDVSMGRVEHEEAERSFEDAPSQSQSQSQGGSQGSGGRPRVSREEVQRCLMRARSASPEMGEAL